MMNLPIPRPKKTEFSGGFIPAVFTANDFDPVFTSAVSVFSAYVRRAFGEFSDGKGALTLIRDALPNDGYRLSVREEGVLLTASDNAGMNRAFATLLQLTERKNGKLFFPKCEIEDAPDSEWRGVMLDVVRRFHDIKYVYAVAEMCWFYKLNRLQLHLSDDQGVRFPFVTLSKAVSAEHYTAEELAKLNDYCKARGIVLVPEIDMPGHFTAFAAAYPELFGIRNERGNTENVMCAKERAFETLQRMFAEVVNIFPDSPWIHIGGDEADAHKWLACPDSQRYCKEKGLQDTAELYAHCVARAAKTILALGRTPVVWEGFSEGYNDLIPKETLVFVWESYYQTAPSLLKSGFRIINASWKPLYIVHPRHRWAPEELLGWEKNVWQNWWEKSLAYEKPIVVPEASEILGGQICVWRDYMKEKYEYAPLADMLQDEFALIRDRVPALAEKTWNCYQSVRTEEFSKDMARLSEYLALFRNGIG